MSCLTLGTIWAPELLGPETILLKYAFDTYGLDKKDVFSHEMCKRLDNIRDLKVDIFAIDGVDALMMQRLEEASFQKLLTPTSIQGGSGGQASAPAAAIAKLAVPASGVTPNTFASGLSTPPASGTQPVATDTNASAGVPLAAAGGVLMLIAAAVVGMRYRASRRRSGALVMQAASASSSGVTTPPATSAYPTRVNQSSIVEYGQETVTPSAVAPDGDEHFPGVLADVPRAHSATFAEVAGSTPLRVRCFGAPQLLRGERILWPSRELNQETKAVELLLFLAASPPEGVDRDAVAEALWPETDVADPGSSVRQVRSRLRRMVARLVPDLTEQAPFLPDFGRAYRLDPEVVASDVHRVVELSRRARLVGNDAIPLLEQARALYERDLFDSPAAPPFSWAIDPGPGGASLRQQYRHMINEDTRLVAELYVRTGETAQIKAAVTLYEELLRADPPDEDVSRALMKALAIRGDTAAVEREWVRLCQVLRSGDATAKPVLETSELYARLSRQS